MRQPKIRQEDIARAAGVSVSTVSRVLSGAPGISATTTARVMKAAAEFGTDLPLAGGAAVIAGHRLKRALLFLNQDDLNSGSGSIYHYVTVGLQKAARDAGLQLQFAVLGDDGDVPAQLLGGGETGVFFAGVDPSVDVLKDLRDRGHPTVLVNGLDPSMTVDQVAPNNFFGGRMAAQHLLEMGHRRVLHLGTTRRWTLRARTDGFRQGIEQSGTSGVACDYVEMGNVTEKEAHLALSKVLKREPFPYTAIFCSADVVALTAMQELQLQGISVPDEVSLLGFNGLPIAEFSSPLLSTMAVDWEYLGSEAVRLLLQRNVEPQRPTEQVQVQVSLRVQETVASLA